MDITLVFGTIVGGSNPSGSTRKNIKPPFMVVLYFARCKFACDCSAGCFLIRYTKHMNIRLNTVVKTLLIAGAILLTIGMYTAVFGLMTKQRSPKQSREASLAIFMPESPSGTQLVGEGYDPKTDCFDKCGYLYRTLSYQDPAVICRNLFAVLSTEGPGFTITSPSSRQPPTEAWCEDRIKQASTFTLNMEAPVRLKTGVQEKSRTIVSVVVSPQQKTVEYRISQVNEGITIVR